MNVRYTLHRLPASAFESAKATPKLRGQKIVPLEVKIVRPRWLSHSHAVSQWCHKQAGQPIHTSSVAFEPTYLCIPGTEQEERQKRPLWIDFRSSSTPQQESVSGVSKRGGIGKIDLVMATCPKTLPSGLESYH